MRILFLSDNFPPEVNAPATRLHDHAVRWVKAGHEVTVVTCAPNFPEGRVFDGYRNRWRLVETIDGIRVVRVKTYITANEGVVRRSLDYASFMLMAFVQGLFEQRPDVVIATSPQFFCAVAGWALAAVRRLPFVFELRDLWPASIAAVGAMRGGGLINALERLELLLYRRADVIVPVTHAFRDDLIARGIDPAKIHVVTNGVDLARYVPAPRNAQLARSFGLEGKFVVGYLGTHGLAHALERVLEAAELLRDRPDIVLFFAGGGAARATVERLAREKGLDNVRMIPRQGKALMPALWGLCDVTLIPLRNQPVFATVIPSKLFEAMAMGVPVIAALPFGEATGIIQRADCGLIVPPENPTAMADAIVRLADEPALQEHLHRGALAGAQLYSRDRQADRFLSVLEMSLPL